MRSKLTIALLVIALMSIGAWSGQGQTDKVRSVSYEYQVLADPTETAGKDEGLKRLNEIGAHGWELVGVGKGGPDAPTLYFKRVKRSL